MLKTIVLALCVLANSAALAQEFPARPITLIVPFPAGGGIDILMRALAEGAKTRLGQPIIIENKAGAGGTIGPAVMATSARPDGYTVSYIPSAVFRLPFISKTPYDPVTDFTYIIGVNNLSFGLAVRKDAPWRNFADFLAEAKSSPGKIAYASPGAGLTPHLNMERISRLAKVELTHVPFKGSSEANSALLGGHVAAIADAAGWAPFVRSGDFRLLVTGGSERMKGFPDAPTLTESGFDIVVSTPGGIAGPKGLDPKIVKALHDAFRLGMDDPAFLKAVAQFDVETKYLSSEAYTKVAMRQIEEQKRAVAEFPPGAQ